MRKREMASPNRRRDLRFMFLWTKVSSEHLCLLSTNDVQVLLPDYDNLLCKSSSLIHLALYLELEWFVGPPTEMQISLRCLFSIHTSWKK